MFTWVTAVVVVLWVSGILAARKRGTSKRAQIAFTVLLLGGIVGDYFVLGRNAPNGALGEEIWAVVLGISALGLVSGRSYLRYGLLAGALFLVFVSFQVSNVAFFYVFGSGLILILLSIAVGRRKGKEGGSTW